ncbi:MAG: citrate transporter [Lachnospiraceae bacterium]|nr:citrate transporter [Lachnospiraceae bacterium]
MKKIIELFQKETVLCIAVLLAVISSFIILPDKEYAGYIDFRTLAILFCLMSVMAGLQQLGVFRMIAQKLLARVTGSGQLISLLVLLCFFFSMLITNDVALITFVPFTFTVLRLLGEEQERKLLVPVVILQTIAANLGSMLTPIGNPQNLYLYTKSGLSIGAFVLLMLPYTVISLILLLICCFLLGRKEKDTSLSVSFTEDTVMTGKGRTLAVYLLLFALCLLAVVHIVNIWVVLIIVLAVLLIMDRRVLAEVDYSLLLTFVGFFVFIGNMGRIPAFYNFLEGLVSGNEVLTSVVSSQVISNVPAALLLSGFTENYKGLIVGTNLGGLGTLIASMASLISYKYIVRESKEKSIKSRYLIGFTISNILFLVVLLVVYILLGEGISIAYIG